jgi:hypothetical protein
VLDGVPPLTDGPSTEFYLAKVELICELMGTFCSVEISFDLDSSHASVFFSKYQKRAKIFVIDYNSNNIM